MPPKAVIAVASLRILFPFFPCCSEARSIETIQVLNDIRAVLLCRSCQPAFYETSAGESSAAAAPHAQMAWEDAAKGKSIVKAKFFAAGYPDRTRSRFGSTTGSPPALALSRNPRTALAEYSRPDAAGRRRRLFRKFGDPPNETETIKNSSALLQFDCIIECLRWPVLLTMKVLHA